MACPVDPKPNESNFGLCAIDAILFFGYRVVRNGILEKAPYRLCGQNSDLHFKSSIDLLLKEIRENAEYYAKEIIERGKKL